MSCKYTTQGVYICEKVDEKSKCKEDNTLKYLASDTNYDMNVKSMLYQLRVTQDGYRTYTTTNKPE
jgi:hypothetical protein